ncbi:hypothetical protein Tco_0203089, partial [Tanacetum coccineum]
SDKEYFNNTLFNIFLYEVISDIDVLGTGMLDWIARDDKDTYSDSAEDIEVQSCVLDDHLTNLSPPRNYMPPDVLLRELRQPV